MRQRQPPSQSITAAPYPGRRDCPPTHHHTPSRQHSHFILPRLNLKHLKHTHLLHPSPQAPQLRPLPPIPISPKARKLRRGRPPTGTKRRRARNLPISLPHLLANYEPSPLPHPPSPCPCQEAVCPVSLPRVSFPSSYRTYPPKTKTRIGTGSLSWPLIQSTRPAEGDQARSTPRVQRTTRPVELQLVPNSRTQSTPGTRKKRVN